MSFVDDIRTIATAIDSGSTTVLLSLSKHEAQTFEYDSFPLVVINRDYTTKTVKAKNGNLLSTRQVTIQFLNSDTWDNRDSDNFSDQTEDASFDISKDMEILSNSVFWAFQEQSGVSTTNFVGIVDGSFDSIPVYRSTSNSLTGVQIVFSYMFYSSLNCA